MGYSLTRLLPGRPPGTALRKQDWRRLIQGLFVSILILAAGGPDRNAVAADPKETFFRAQSCYETLRAHPKKQKYRSNWFTCIDKFKSVYNTFWPFKSLVG